jgi:hypothetical protein
MLWTGLFGQVKSRLFWRQGSVSLSLLILVLFAVDTYTVRAIRTYTIQSAIEHLEAHG